MSRGLQPFQVNEYLTKKIIQDLVIECSSATQVVIKAGSTAGADDGSVVMEAAADLTLDITTSGKNGLDTGAEASDTWYYVWMIWNPSTAEVAGLLSASATSPTLPSGFTKKRLVGAVRNNSSSNFQLFTQVNKAVQYEGDITFATGTYASFTQFDLSSMVPVTSQRVVFVPYSHTSPSSGPSEIQASVFGTSGTFLQRIPTDSAWTSNDYWKTQATSNVDESQNVYIRMSGDTGSSIAVAGFTLNL